MAGASNNNGKGGRQAPPVDVGSPLLDWEEADHFSFEDSERFEEDSLCSWSSEPESLCNNWRGWRRPNLPNTFGGRATKKSIQGNSIQLILCFELSQWWQCYFFTNHAFTFNFVSILCHEMLLFWYITNIFIESFDVFAL